MNGAGELVTILLVLDGVDNNDTSVPGTNGGVLSANPDATQEFRVITNNFMPEYGRNTGAIVDVVTKSGSNPFTEMPTSSVAGTDLAARATGSIQPARAR